MSDRIVTASDDKTTRLWDRNGNLLATLQGYQDWVNSAEFSLKGDRIVTVSEYTARIWPVETLDDLLNRGCDWLTEYLTTHPDQNQDNQGNPLCPKLPTTQE